MPFVDLGVAAVAIACFNLFWWCLRLARRLQCIERTTKTDPLTGLGSGHWLDAERWPAALRSGQPVAIAYVDLDCLKARNDRQGHAAGDLYIQEAAHALRQASRRGVDEVFRVYTAGDEFLVVLHGALDPAKVAENLLARLRSYGVSASLGLAYSTETQHVPARVGLRLAAEQACRAAKARGGDCAVTVADPVNITSPRLRRASLPSLDEAAGNVPQHIDTAQPHRFSVAAL